MVIPLPGTYLIKNQNYFSPHYKEHSTVYFIEGCDVNCSVTQIFLRQAFESAFESQSDFCKLLNIHVFCLYSICTSLFPATFLMFLFNNITILYISYPSRGRISSSQNQWTVPCKRSDFTQTIFLKLNIQ